MSDRTGCVLPAIFLAIAAFFIVAEVARSLVWIRWAFGG